MYTLHTVMPYLLDHCYDYVKIEHFLLPSVANTITIVTKIKKTSNLFFSKNFARVYKSFSLVT